MARCFLKWNKCKFTGFRQYREYNSILRSNKLFLNYLLFKINFVRKSVDNVDEIESRTIKEIISTLIYFNWLIKNNI